MVFHMWSYAIGTGVLAQGGETRGRGYAGRGQGRNNIAMIRVAMMGPIPPGRYRIGKAYDHPLLGPVTMNLEPLPGTQMFGRSLFRIHGDNKAGDASQGCIVLGRTLRESIAQSGDDQLDVTA